ARRWQQQSRFGAALDVVVDIAQRGGMWVLALNLPGFLFPLVELNVFACTHSSGSESWKVTCFEDAPMLVAAVTSNVFKSPCGALMVAGLHFLPLWLWLRQRTSASFPGFNLVGFLLCSGRLLGLVVEFWVLKRHVEGLLRKDAASLSERANVKNK
ncbi:unnamed protein product, partial [Durusdinium trenchii]